MHMFKAWAVESKGRSKQVQAHIPAVPVLDILALRFHAYHIHVCIYT